jgi:hypothetical protein
MRGFLRDETADGAHGGRERGVVVGVEVVEQVGEGLGPGPAARGEHRAPSGVTVTSTPRRSAGSGARSTSRPRPACRPARHRGLRDALGLGELGDAPRAAAFEVGEVAAATRLSPPRGVSRGRRVASRSSSAASSRRSVVSMAKA